MIPQNIETFEKEKLYEEKMRLKMQKNEVARENTIIKTHLKAVEGDLKKKDDLIKRLTEEMKRNPGAQYGGNS